MTARVTCWLRLLPGAVLLTLGLTGCVVDDEEERFDAAIVPDIVIPPVPECEPGVERPCPADEACTGVQVCVDGFWGDCGPAEADACDGLDNDCDGNIDEDFPELGTICADGEGLCRVEGRVICGPDNRSTICTAVAGDGGEETCNGVDDDCDGTTDEASLEPAGCPSDLFGACSRGEIRCVDGEPACAPITEPSEESCDGVDNDCDGLTDEDPQGAPLTAPCYEGPEGTEGVGACAPGVRICRRGAFQTCEGQVRPRGETCDGADDDCDGAVDEGEGCACQPGDQQPCYDGPPGTEGVGACAPGVSTCRADGTGFGPCRDAVIPGLELCNGRDDDCNGAVDDVASRGDACTDGVGGCARDGTFECDLEIGQLICSATAGEPAPEVCNGVDDDCNGRTDDVPGANTRCTDGIGGCQAIGLQVCDPAGGDRLVCSATAGEPADERCNAVDDDCDDIIDEVEGLGQPCEDGEGACLSVGVTVCDPIAEEIVCGAIPAEPVDESCNGLDDDCDGEVDNVPTIGEACTNNIGGCAVEGRLVCVPDDAVDGALSCDAVPRQPQVEVCNALDDDCDGVIDEVRGLGEDCTLSFGVCLTEGETICDLEAQAVVCGAEVIPPGPEDICFNTLDDDCDGTVDEGPCPEQCDNDLDDDLDEAVDCLDADCAGARGCPCGNGVVDDGEECDDGGLEVDDGCDDTCMVEGGFVCDTPPGDACGPDRGLVELDRNVGDPLPFIGDGALGAPFLEACPPGSALIGFDLDGGFSGLRSVAGVCGAPQVTRDGTIYALVEVTAAVGTDAPEPERALCPDGMVVRGLAWDSTDGALTAPALRVRCGRLGLVNGQLIAGPPEDNPGYGIIFGDRAEQDCPAGAVAAAIAGRTVEAVGGENPRPDGVGALALRCDTVRPICGGASTCRAGGPF